VHPRSLAQKKQPNPAFPWLGAASCMHTAWPDGCRRLPNTAGLHPAGLVEADGGYRTDPYCISIALLANVLLFTSVDGRNGSGKMRVEQMLGHENI
jgi:hypothetical protein